jgi:hypothetical protein
MTKVWGGEIGRRLAGFLGKRLYLLTMVIGAVTLPQTASAKSTTLTYVGYLAGFPVIDLTATVDIPVAAGGAGTTAASGAYRVDAVMATSGNFAALYPYRQEMKAQGSMAKAKPVPKQFQSDATIWQRRETITLAYGAGGQVTVTANPLTQQARQAVREGYANGTMDPASAVMAFVAAFSQRQDCGGAYAVFDGVRRYDIMVEKTGGATVNKLQRSVYQGPATECSATPKLVGGFQQAAVQSQLYPQKARLWLAPALKGFPAVPVRISATNAFGEMVLDLVAIQ